MSPLQEALHDYCHAHADLREASISGADRLWRTREDLERTLAAAGDRYESALRDFVRKIAVEER